MLGKHLVSQHFANTPKRYSIAFITGCIQPDRNPATYLKGSLRSRLLHGHNWSNSQRYMNRICRRLQNRKKLRLLDYYTMGKLIHYTVDAFTFSHNERFTDNIRTHRRYESHLESHFLRHLTEDNIPELRHSGSVMETINSYHAEYGKKKAGMSADCKYSILVSNLVVIMLLGNYPLSLPGL